MQARRTEVYFRQTPAPSPDLPATSTAEFRVTLYRINRPGWKVETESIAQSSRWTDPLYDSGASSDSLFLVPLREDRRLARELAERSARRLERSLADEPATQDQPAPSPSPDSLSRRDHKDPPAASVSPG